MSSKVSCDPSSRKGKILATGSSYFSTSKSHTVIAFPTTGFMHQVIKLGLHRQLLGVLTSSLGYYVSIITHGT